MVKLIWVLLAGLLLGVAAWFGIGSDSYVLIRIGEWAVQLSVWAVLLALVLLWLVLGVLKSLLGGFGFFAWRRKQVEERQRRQLASSFESFFEADWKASGKGFLKLADRLPDPEPSLWMAASAAQRAGDAERALRILDNIERAFPRAAKALALQRAQLYLDSQQVNEGMEQVAIARKLGANPVELNLMEAQLAHLRGDTQALQKAVKALQGQRLARADFTNLQRYYYLLQLAREGMPKDELRKLLRSIPASSLSDAALAQHLVARVRELPADEATDLLAGLIEKSWRPELITAYGEIESSQVRKQLKRAERWHANHLSLELLETLQKLSWRASDSDRAHDYAQQMRVLRRSRND